MIIPTHDSHDLFELSLGHSLRWSVGSESFELVNAAHVGAHEPEPKKRGCYHLAPWLEQRRVSYTSYATQPTPSFDSHIQVSMVKGTRSKIFRFGLTFQRKTVIKAGAFLNQSGWEPLPLQG